MSLLQFNTDVMFEIAKYDEDVWWKIWLLSSDFREYTKNNTTVFVKLFNNPEHKKDKTVWYLCGEIHRGDDLPAIIRSNGTQEWWYNGKCHRENDKPAIIYWTGDKEWWYNGAYHRENDRPAMIHGISDWQIDGVKLYNERDRVRRWFSHGKLHRDKSLDLPAVITFEYKEWWYNGMRHRENDMPARIGRQGIMEWFINDKRHREEEPAYVDILGGTSKWYCNGVLHRDASSGEPAVIGPDGSREWWSYGQRHRENDEPAVIHANGAEEWWIKGKMHRENDMPALKRNGRQEWWYHGKRHRDGGKPAIIDFKKNKSVWYFEDKRYDRKKAPTRFVKV